MIRNHPVGNKPNKFIPPRPQLSAVQPDLFIELCSPCGLQKEVKVTTLQKDTYLPFSLLDGLKCSWDKALQAWNTSVACSRTWGRRERDKQEGNLGHRECLS